MLVTHDAAGPPAINWSLQHPSTVVEVKGSHAVYVSQPQALASIIEKAAQNVMLALNNAR